MRVLIAEDDLVTRTLMVRAAAHAGHESIAVANGEEMLAAFEQQRPDVALVDWRMPVLDGVDAIREMRRRPGGHDVFVVIVTGVEGEVETARALEAGIDDYLLKPISAPRLRLILRLADVRLARRRSAPGDPLRAFAADEVLRMFGFVAGADASGRLMFVYNHPQADELIRGGAGLERLFDGDDGFGSALTLAAETGQPASFRPEHGDWAGVELTITTIARNGMLAAYIIGEARRMTSEATPVEQLRRVVGE